MMILGRLMVGNGIRVVGSLELSNSSTKFLRRRGGVLLLSTLQPPSSVLPPTAPSIFVVFSPRAARYITNPRFCHTKLKARLDPGTPFAYYDILEIPRTAKQSEVKAAYFRQAKIYHPDVAGEDEVARENFEALTEAYTTLIDLTQRYFYDQHGYSSQELKKKGSNSTIFDWKPRYSVYSERSWTEGESSELEDWMKAQGHSGVNQEKISLRQRAKNAWVELWFGLDRYDFPWRWNSFIIALCTWLVVFALLRYTLVVCMQKFSYRKPVQLNFKWENTDIYDILWYVGARKNMNDKGTGPGKGLNFPTNSAKKAPKSELSVAGMHHMPKKKAGKKSEYSHTIYSNTRSRSLKKNKERHKVFLKERKREQERVAAWKMECEERKEEFAERENKLRKKRKKRKVTDGFSV